MTVPIPMLGNGPYGTSRRSSIALAKPATTAVVKEVKADSPRESVDATNSTAAFPSRAWKAKILQQYNKFYHRRKSTSNTNKN